MKLADHLLENKIKCAETALLSATDKNSMSEAHRQMAELIAQRSAEYVREMELRKGIARA